MKKNKLLKAVICLLTATVLLTASAASAFAAKTATAALSFSVKNAPGTVVLEPQGNAPVPDKTTIENATQGSFSLSFAQADTYRYKIYQQNKDSSSARYDAAVYDVTVTVLFDEGEFTTVVTVNKEGDNHKLPADGIIFENTAANSGISLHKTVTGVGDKSRDWHFTVTLSEPVNGKYGDVEFKDGVGEVTLKSGETATADGIFPGVEYKVTEKEANKDGYKTVSENAEGTTVSGKLLPVSFENRKSLFPRPPQTGDRTRIGIWIALSLLCTASLICLILVKRKNKSKS